MKIFESDYLILPINENNEHWSLIIITYPGRMKNIFESDAEIGFDEKSKNINGNIESQENQEGLVKFTLLFLIPVVPNNNLS